MSKHLSLRDKQMRDILAYDQDISRKAFNQEIRWVKQWNETYEEPDRAEKRVAFEIEQFFIKLSDAVDSVKDQFYSTRAEQPVGEIVKQYQLLIAYLKQYMIRRPLNQRDLAVIEDKFDLLAVPIDEIATIANLNHWRGEQSMRNLADLLNNHNYISLENSSLKPIPAQMVQAPFQAPNVTFDRPMKSKGVEMVMQTDNLSPQELKGYIEGLSSDEIKQILYYSPLQSKILDEFYQIKANKPSASLKKEIKRNPMWSQAIYDASIQNASPRKKSSKQEAQPVEDQLDFGDPRIAETASSYQDYQRFQQREALKELNRRASQYGAAVGSWEDLATPSPAFDESRQSLEEQGDGHRASIGKASKKYGKGTNEGFLGGLPGGMRTQLAYNPKDSVPLGHLLPVSEKELTLPMKMQFLNNTERHRVYDDDEVQINSQSNYKKMLKRNKK